MMDFLYSLPPVVLMGCLFIVWLAGCSMGLLVGRRVAHEEYAASIGIWDVDLENKYRSHIGLPEIEVEPIEFFDISVCLPNGTKNDPARTEFTSTGRSGEVE